ncbi:MAG: protein phosphatase 2C domain-containing protein [Chloroflexota bacterium]
MTNPENNENNLNIEDEGATAPIDISMAETIVPEPKPDTKDAMPETKRDATADATVPIPTFPVMSNSSSGDNDTKQMVIEENLFNDFDGFNGGWLVGAMTNVGIVRTNNEDSIYTFLSKLEDTDTFPQFGVFMVADGAGGHQNGEVASSVTLRTVAKAVIKNIYIPLLNKEDINDLDRPTISDILTDAIRESDRLVREQVPDGGCTCTVGVITGNILNIGHVGDSRLYLINRDHIEQITRDHSVVGRLVEIGDITPEEAKHHPKRSVLYRGVGMGRGEEQFEVDITRKRLKTGDQILICSDGLWELVDDDEIKNIVMNAQIPQLACRALISEANLNGGNDNISVVIATGPER